MKKTLIPVSVKPDIDNLISLVLANSDNFNEDTNAQIQGAIKSIEKNFIDTAALVRVSSFAKVYGIRYLDRKISKQAIYQKIDKGIVPEIVIDGVKFIDQTMLQNGE